MFKLILFLIMLTFSNVFAQEVKDTSTVDTIYVYDIDTEKVLVCFEYKEPKCYMLKFDKLLSCIEDNNLFKKYPEIKYHPRLWR